MKLLEGKSAIITGSSRGIGREIARLFAENGAGLVIHGTSEEKLIALKNELNLNNCVYIA
ncbi:MAG: SDR family NAD(P)-dependent oxidoreductase, partial [Synergistaceae bacterium]|nr:SDR family NAD(P)-dependent oxidoreductase [Synergistaceae bacterium]